jgi:glycosyltransferase involved in cell wall biosynthesis
MRTLVAIPIFNEARYVTRVIRHVLEFASDVLVIDDGSTDATPELLASLPVQVIGHERNSGYGASLIDAFARAEARGYDWVITMDCDEQHEPARLPVFFDAQRRADIAGDPLFGTDIFSGSRYIASMDEGTTPPADRRAINVAMTAEINQRLALDPPLTDTFCGYKSHRVSALKRLTLTETGYAFPMQFWPQVVAHGLRIAELPVKLIYKDLTRTFGGQLDDPGKRLAHYRCVLHREITRLRDHLPACAADVLSACD